MKIDLPIFQVIKEKISERNSLSLVGLAGGSKAFFLLGLAEKLNSPVLGITKTTEASLELVQDLEALKIFFTLPKKIDLYLTRNKSEQVAGLNEILENRIAIIVTAQDNLEHNLLPKNTFLNSSRQIEIEQEINRNEFIRYLTSVKYERVDYVEQPVNTVCAVKLLTSGQQILIYP